MKKQKMTELILHEAPAGYDPLEAQRVLQGRMLERFPHAPVLDAEGNAEDVAMVLFLSAQAIAIESAEALDHLSTWKWWKDNADADVSLAEYDAIHDGAVTETKYEWIDALHFWLNGAIALGMDWQECMDLLFTKQTENHDRQDRGY
jgi:hypothetical protein